MQDLMRISPRQDSAQKFRRIRFEKAGDGPYRLHCCARCGIAMRGQENDVDSIASQQARDFDSAFLAQSDVDQRQPGMMSIEFEHSLPTGGSDAADFKAPMLEIVGNVEGDQRLVLDDQHGLVLERSLINVLGINVLGPLRGRRGAGWSIGK
jgi:hypothetical protein